jgi:hypothetical protein
LVVTIELDPARIAEEANAEAGGQVETEGSVRRWVRDNLPNLRSALEDQIIEHLADVE